MEEGWGGVGERKRELQETDGKLDGTSVVEGIQQV